VVPIEHPVAPIPRVVLIAPTDTPRVPKLLDVPGIILVAPIDPLLFPKDPLFAPKDPLLVPTVPLFAPKVAIAETVVTPTGGVGDTDALLDIPPGWGRVHHLPIFLLQYIQLFITQRELAFHKVIHKNNCLREPSNMVESKMGPSKSLWGSYISNLWVFNIDLKVSSGFSTLTGIS